MEDVKYKYIYPMKKIPLKPIPSEITFNKPTIYNNVEIYNLEFVRHLNILNETYKDIYNQIQTITKKYTDIRKKLDTLQSS